MDSPGGTVSETYSYSRFNYCVPRKGKIGFSVSGEPVKRTAEQGKDVPVQIGQVHFFCVKIKNKKSGYESYKR